MDIAPNELLMFLTRWAHVIAGIMWIGNSFYFMWLDANITPPDPPNDEVTGDLWMVHSGGFYQVEKRLIQPGHLPPVLHWFKWEATFTWITGFLLFSMLFYMRDGAYLIDPNVRELGPGIAIVISLALLAGSWVIYDLFWTSKLAHNERVANIVSCIAVFALTYGLCHLFSGRAAFLHLGAIFGTLMVTNVWVRILPAQSAMIAAADRGDTPDFTLGDRAKKRSTHNSYMTLPVIFTMLSGHLASVVGHHSNWVLLSLFFVFGMAVRHAMILCTKSKTGTLPLPGFVAVLALSGIIYTMEARPQASTPVVDPNAPAISDADMFLVVQARCTPCHSTSPSDTTFGPLAAAVVFDEIAHMNTYADRIRVRVVDTKTMPLINKTEMSEDERLMFDQWSAVKLSEK